MNKYEKIELIMRLASGEIKPEDLRPKKVIWEIFFDGSSKYSIDGHMANREEFNAVWNKQFDRDSDNMWLELINDGISLHDPDYLKKIIERSKAKGTIK